jgi:SSS family solute:Na+ symporter
MIVGALISVGGVLAKQISADWLADTSSFYQLKSMLEFIRNINGQEYWAISMGASALSYVVVSIVEDAEPFDMDKLLNRGKYAISGEKKIVNKDTELGWRIFMMGDEFTKGDKLIYILNYAWTGIWTLVFIIGTIYNLSNDVSDATWMVFWKNYIYIHIVISLSTIVWFTIGGFRDLKIMMEKLNTEHRDHHDDGWVSEE